MKEILGAAAICALLAIAGCGGGSGDSPSDELAESATSVTEEVDSVEEAPSIAESKAFVASLVPEVKGNIREVGADLFGTPEIKCAATGGPETECIMEVPFRRLDDCAIASTTVMVVNGDGGLESTEDSGEIEARTQICYIGANGEPVPERP